KISEGFATQFLVNACAGARARQRPRYNLDDLGIIIPAAVWRDAHFDLDTGVLYPAGTIPLQDEGYGEAGNGIIEVAQDELREHLRKPAPRKVGRKTKVTPKVEQEVFAMLEYHGLPNPDDPEWNAQARVEEVIEDRTGLGRTQARIHARCLIDKWNAGKG